MRKNETKLVLDTVRDIAQLSLIDNQRSDHVAESAAQSLRENIAQNCDFYEVIGI